MFIHNKPFYKKIKLYNIQKINKWTIREEQGGLLKVINLFRWYYIDITEYISNV